MSTFMRRSFVLATLVVLVACGGDSGPSAPPTPDFGITVSPATLTIVIGEEDDYQIAVTRTNGFAGDVVVTVDNLPRGVTSTPLTVPSGVTSGTLRVGVGVTAEPGVYALTVRGTASGLSPRSTDAVLVTRIVT